MNLINGGAKEAANNAIYYQTLEAMQQMAELQQMQATSAAATQKADASAAAAQAQVKGDNAQISSDFGQFDPSYYNNYRTAYANYYQPQVADQYKQAQDQLTAALAGNGTLESTAGAQALANLAKRETDQTAQIQSQADAAVTAQQQKVAGAQTGLQSEANAGVDPTQIASNAVAQTTALAAPQTYTPLGQVFSDLVTPFSNYTKSAAGAPAAGIPLINNTVPTAYNNAGQTGGGANPYPAAP